MTELFSDRLAQVIAQLGVKQKDFAKALGVSRSFISMLLSGKSGASDLFLQHLAVVYAVNPVWLTTGEGPMFSQFAQALLGPPLKFGKAPPGIEPTVGGPPPIEQLDYDTIPILEDAAAAGDPAVVRDEAITGWAVVHHSQIRPGRHAAIYVRGDSMFPLLKDGDLVAVNFDRRDPRDLEGKVIVAAIDEGVTIKYLRSSRPGRYLLMPENSREFTPLDLAADELRIVGTVEFAFKKFD